jgi:hypothetical protein
MKRITLILFIVIIVTVGSIMAFDFFQKKSVGNAAYELLKHLEQEDYDAFIKEFHPNQELLKKIDKKELGELSALLQNSLWEIEYVREDLSGFLVVLYINEAPESINGSITYIEMWKNNDGWRASFAANSFFGGIFKDGTQGKP